MNFIKGSLEAIQLRHYYKWDYFEWLHKGNPTRDNPKRCVYDDLEEEFKRNYGKDPSITK